MKNKKNILVLSLVFLILIFLVVIGVNLINSSTTKLDNRPKAAVGNTTVDLLINFTDTNISTSQKVGKLRVVPNGKNVEGFETRIEYDPNAITLAITNLGVASDDIFLVENPATNIISVQVGFIDNFVTSAFDYANITATKKAGFTGNTTTIKLNVDSYVGINEGDAINTYPPSTASLANITTFTTNVVSSSSSSTVSSVSSTSQISSTPSSISSSTFTQCSLCNTNFNYLSPDLYKIGNSNGLVNLYDFITFKNNYRKVQCMNPADYDLNCKVDLLDFVTFKKYFGKRLQDIQAQFNADIASAAQSWPRCDVNRDGTVNTTDGTAVNTCLNQPAGTGVCRYVDVDNSGTITIDEKILFQTRCASIF